MTWKPRDDTLKEGGGGGAHTHGLPRTSRLQRSHYRILDQRVTMVPLTEWFNVRNSLFAGAAKKKIKKADKTFPYI